VYPIDTLFFADPCYNHNFNLSNFGEINPSILGYEEGEHDGDTDACYPRGIGSVTLEFEEDLILKKGTFFKSPETRHVRIEVPITITE